MKILTAIIILSVLVSCKKETDGPEPSPTPTGTAVFYTTHPMSQGWNLRVDGTDYGPVTHTNIVPECGEENFQTLTLTQGDHTVVFVATSGQNNETVIVNISPNHCEVVKCP